MQKNIKQLSNRAHEILFNYNFPGNIRELENTIEHGFILCKKNTIDVEHLPSYLLDKNKPKVKTSLSKTSISELEMMEKESILDALRRCQWNRQKAADELGLSRTTLWRKLKKLELIS